jgi:hypothetical protein
MQLVLSTISGIVLHQFQLFPRQTAMFFHVHSNFFCVEIHISGGTVNSHLCSCDRQMFDLFVGLTSMKPIVHDPKMGRENVIFETTN